MIKVLMIGNDPSVKGGISSVINQILSFNWRAEGINMNFIPTYIKANNLKKILFFGKAYINICKAIKKKPTGYSTYSYVL